MREIHDQLLGLAGGEKTVLSELRVREEPPALDRDAELAVRLQCIEDLFRSIIAQRAPRVMRVPLEPGAREV